MTAQTIDMSHKRAALAELDTARANIGAQSMFCQPTSWDQLTNWLERHTGGERVHVTTAAVMAWNLAARFDGHNEATEAQRTMAQLAGLLDGNATSAQQEAFDQFCALLDVDAAAAWEASA